MPNPIDIIIDAIWRGGGATRRAEQELRSLGKTGSATAKRQTTDFRALAKEVGAVTVAFTVAAVATKKFLQTAEEGAGLRLVTQRFDRLAESIGSSGDSLREALSFSSGGLLSEAQQMALATDLIGLNIANTATEAARFSRVITELDQDINEVILAISNQGTRRFDQLNLSVFGFEERLAALKAEGLSTEEAFSEAFLQQAEAQIERVGGVTDTAAGDFKILRANAADTFDQLKIGLSEAIEPIIGGLADMVRAAKSAEGAVADLKAQILELGEGDSVAAVEAVAAAIREVGPAGSPFAPQQTIKTRDALIDLAVELTKTADTFEARKTTLESFGFEVDELGFRLEGMGVAWRELDNAIANLPLTAPITNVGKAVDDTADEFDALIEKLDALVSEYEESQSSAENFLETAGVSVETFAALSEQLGSTGAALEYIQAVMQDTGQVTDDLTISVEELIEAQERQDQLSSGRANLFEAFQDDLTDLAEQYGVRRRDITERYEEQRTSIVEDYSRRRAQEEEDWQLRRARQEEDYRRQIDDVRETAADSEADARESANRRIEDLEEDHLQRIQDIIDNANLQLQDAASRLDANAVARIERQRDQALEQEQDNYQDQRQQIQETLAQQLEDIRENMEERLADLAEFHEERLEQEAEDRAIRLRRLEEDHRRQLQELKQQERDRLNEIKRAYSQEKNERTKQYIDERGDLFEHLQEKQDQEEFFRNELLRQEEAWWQQRINLIGGGDADTGNGGNAGGGGAGDVPGGDGGTGETPPGRPELQQIAISQMQLANWTEDMIFAQLAIIRDWTDAKLAEWIENTFGYDVPGYQMGIDYVPRTGPAILHQGEAVLSPANAARFRSSGGAGGMTGVTVNNNIYPSPGMDEAGLARMVDKRTEETMKRVFDRMAG